MRSIKILQMINDGRIEDLKEILRDEIYQEVLSSKSGEKKRYAYMKKYFSFIKPTREILQKPCIVKYEGEPYISFCNSYTAALTTERSGAIELCSEPENYPDIARLITIKSDYELVDFKKVYAEAASKGYKLLKSFMFSNHYLLKYKDTFYRFPLFDMTYGIIDNGEPAMVYHTGEQFSPIIVQNDIGICMVLPIRLDPENVSEDDDIVIIEAKTE